MWEKCLFVLVVEGRSIVERGQGPALRTAGTGFTCDRRPRVLTLSMIPRSPQYCREIVHNHAPRTINLFLKESRDNYREICENVRAPSRDFTTSNKFENSTRFQRRTWNSRALEFLARVVRIFTRLRFLFKFLLKFYYLDLFEVILKLVHGGLTIFRFFRV